MRTRKYFLTLWEDNQDKETNETIHNNLEEFVEELLKRYTLSYIIHYKEQDEKRHIHIYINNKQAIDFNTLKRINKYMHIEQVKGNDNQIHKYMLHKDIKSIEQGKPEYEENELKGNYQYEYDKKNEIGKNLIEDIESGMTLWEIIQNNTNLWHSIDKIEKLYLIYQNYLYRKYDLMDFIEKEGKIIKREDENYNYFNNSTNNTKISNEEKK